jgi:2-polyprenyl-3-methyl-5-hydroxy-6-metoxy-1,4-benzoquinol methylase
MEEKLRSYYDKLAPYYKYIYQDWESSVVRQGEALDSVIKEYFGNEVGRILDASCGIGTQAIGLAEMGYHLTGTDISPEAIRGAKDEAQKRGLDINFFVADMRRMEDIFQEPFDLIIACDNAVPHLLSKKEILKAFRGFYQGTKPQGGCLISVRDYSALDRESGKTRMFPRKIHRMAEGRMIMFDVWDFEGDFYEITTFIVEQNDSGEIKTSVVKGGKYFCIETGELEYLFLQAGFKKVITLQDRFFQPLIVAKK